MGGLLKNIKIGQGGLIKTASSVVGNLGKGLVSGASTLIKDTISSAGSAGATILNSKGGAAFGGSASSIFGGKPVDNVTMAAIMNDSEGGNVMAGRAAAKDNVPSGDGLTAPKSGVWKYLTFYKMNYETGYFLLDAEGKKQFSWFNAIIAGGVVTITWLLTKKKRSSGSRSRRPARKMRMSRTYKRR